MDAISAIVAAKDYHSQCPGACLGPGERACNSYFQLMNETKPFPSNQDYFKWPKDHSNFQGRTFESNISIGVWYNFSTIANTEWANLLTVTNVDGGSGVESRIINLWLNQPWYYLHNFLGVTNPQYVEAWFGRILRLLGIL